METAYHGGMPSRREKRGTQSRSYFAGGETGFPDPSPVGEGPSQGRQALIILAGVAVLVLVFVLVLILT